MTRRRIVDACTFATELELLEFRLELLDPVVDRFVVVEAPRTHGGDPKPLAYRDHADRFARFHHKIRHVVVDDLPDPVPDRWVPENFQRNAIVRGLDGVGPDDLVVVADVDEIPDPAVLERLATTPAIPDRVAPELRACYFRANWEAPTTWPLLRIARRGAFEHPQELRDTAPLFAVPDAGAHFSYLMDEAGIARKRAWIAESSPEVDRRHLHIEEEIAFGVMLTVRTTLTPRGPERWNPVQQALFERHPGAFDLTPLPPRPLRWLYRKFGALRSTGRSPRVVSAAADLAMAPFVRRRPPLRWSPPGPPVAT